MQTTSKLALLGGSPIRSLPLPKYNTIGAEEKKAVMEVLDSGELSGFTAGAAKEFYGGPRVLALEEEFKKYFQVKYAIAVNSATSGLHCAVNALCLEPGDEVITSPYTMAASATCVLMCGGVPIFADIEDKTFCLDPKSVEQKITNRTKAIVAVNIFGHPANLFELKKIAEKHKLKIIEDNAQAPDADYFGKKTGTIGDAGVFSFNRHKTIQCGEGGVIITNDDDLALRCALFRNHGEIYVGIKPQDDIRNTMGVNYRMTEMEAAVALVQFRKLKEFNNYRIKLARRLDSGLKSIEGLTHPTVEENCSHVYYFYPIKYDQKVMGISRELFSRAVQAEGFTLRSGYVKPVYMEPLFQKKICWGSSGFPFSANPRYKELNYSRGICPVTEKLHDEQMMVTNIIYQPLTENDMDDFIKACHKVIHNIGELKKL